MKTSATIILPMALILILLASCGDDSPTGPQTGTVQVSVATNGEPALAQDGYTINIPGVGTQDIEPNADTTFADLDAGNYEVGLTDMADDCTVQGENPQQVTVSAGEKSQASFEVSCTATVAQEGEEMIPPTWTYDLDSGTLDPPNEATDLWFQVIEAKVERYLSSWSWGGNNSTIGLSGATAPGKAGCLEMELSDESIEITELAEGTFVCVETTEGQLAEVEITQAVPEGERRPLGIRFIIYE